MTGIICSIFNLESDTQFSTEAITFSIKISSFLPPAKKNLHENFELIFNNGLLHNDGIIILHRKKNEKEKLQDYYKVIDERVYGISKVTFGKFLS